MHSVLPVRCHFHCLIVASYSNVQCAELFDNRVRHSEIMQKKIALYEAGLEDGRFTTSIWPRLNYTKCVNGVAEAIKGDPKHTFKCKNMDLYDFINHHTLGSPGFNTVYNETGSGSWGWTDPKSGREFIGKLEAYGIRQRELTNCSYSHWSI